MKRLLWRSFALLLLATAARAQEIPTADFAAGYAHFHIVTGFTIATDGASGSLAWNVNRWLGVAGDLGAYRGSFGTGLTVATYTSGPRVSYRKANRATPFAQALVGGAHFSSAVGGVPNSTGDHFAFAFGGGIDIALGRSGRFALRPEGEYFGWRANGSTVNDVRLGIGIAYRIGRR